MRAGRGGDCLDRKRVIELRGAAQSLRATVFVGKEGITDAVLREIAAQIDKHKLVKVKLLPAFEDDRKLAGEALASRSGAVLIEVRGRTVVLAKG